MPGCCLNLPVALHNPVEEINKKSININMIWMWRRLINIFAHNPVEKINQYIGQGINHKINQYLCYVILMPAMSGNDFWTSGTGTGNGKFHSHFSGTGIQVENSNPIFGNGNGNENSIKFHSHFRERE